MAKTKASSSEIKKAPAKKKTTATASPKKKPSASASSTTRRKSSEKMPTKSAAREKTKESKSVVAEIVENDESSEAFSPPESSEKAYAIPMDEIDDLGDLESDITESDDGKSRAVALAPSKSITSSDPLAMYLNEIRRYKILTREEEAALAKRYFESKDSEAAEALVKANLRFVVKVAAEYSKFGAKMIDLIQEGNVGLMHAVREYNPYKGARLITYAVWWIRGYIQEFLMRQYSMVRIGTTQNQRKLFYQLQKQRDALGAMGIEPSAALIGSRLGIPEDEVRDMAQRMSGRDVSLDRPLDDESGASLGDMQKSAFQEPLDEILAREEQLDLLKRKVEALRADLSDREKIILDERVLNDDPLTLQEIGEKYGITREAVRQMEARLMKKIKTKMEEDN